MPARGRHIPLSAYAIGILLVVALAAAGFSMLRAPVSVDTARIDRGPVVLDIADEGVIRVRDMYLVSASAAGRLTRVEARPGDRVRRGQVLARIGPAPSAPLDARAARELEALITAAQARLAEAVSASSLAQHDLDRTTRLAERGIASPAALERATAAARAAEAAVAARRAELTRARAGLSAAGVGAGGVVVAAPVRGVVLQVMQESEAIVAPGAPILALGDPAQIEAVGEFLSQDAVRIPEGAPALIEDWGGQALRGTVERVEPFARLEVSALGVEEQRANVIVRFDDPEAAAALGHGYQVTVRVMVGGEAAALRVPIEALVRDAQGWSVFRVEDGRARLARVELGEASGPHRPVLAGLAEGEAVVLFPPPSLRDGERVRVTPP